MRGEKLELVRGSGNVFRDVGRENADIEQLKALLAAEILKALDREKLTVRAAHAKTGFAAADFSRVRNADLGRFTADRLMSMLNRLGSRVEVKIRIRSLKPERSSAIVPRPIGAPRARYMPTNSDQPRVGKARLDPDNPASSFLFATTLEKGGGD